MPLVKVNLRKNRDDATKRKISEAIQASLVEVLGVPNEDLYQLFNEYDAVNFVRSDGYLGLKYTDELLMIEVAFIHGRPDELKKKLLADMNSRLVATGGVGADDVFIIISEFGKANVSFGQGLAQRAT